VRVPVPHEDFELVEGDPDEEADIPEVEAADDPRPSRPAKRRKGCPECGSPLEKRAVLCIECGYDLRTGEKLTTEVKRLNLYLDPGWPPVLRYVLLGLLVLLLLFVTGLLVLNRVDIAIVLVVLLFGILALVLAIGTFPRWNLRRTKKGRLMLGKVWHIAFVPVGTVEMNLKRFSGVVIHYEVPSRHQPVNPVFAQYGLIGGLIGALIMTRNEAQYSKWDGSDREVVIYNVYLRPKQALQMILLYRGTSEKVMDTIVDTLVDVAGMRILPR
jgi:hypothetical protein